MDDHSVVDELSKYPYSEANTLGVLKYGILIKIYWLWMLMML